MRTLNGGIKQSAVASTDRRLETDPVTFGGATTATLLIFDCLVNGGNPGLLRFDKGASLGL